MTNDSVKKVNDLVGFDTTSTRKTTPSAFKLALEDVRSERESMAREAAKAKISELLKLIEEFTKIEKEFNKASASFTKKVTQYIKEIEGSDSGSQEQQNSEST